MKHGMIIYIGKPKIKDFETNQYYFKGYRPAAIFRDRQTGAVNWKSQWLLEQAY
jgi:hypothetical protein